MNVPVLISLSCDALLHSFCFYVSLRNLNEKYFNKKDFK